MNPMATRILDADLFKKMITGGAACLSVNASVVNDLNVFPIPDGDTGDNMSLTINGGLQYLNQHHTNSISEASNKLAKGMLMSARGNSGVILSQLFAGMANEFQGMETADISSVSKALQAGVKTAYSSVVSPTEGTILTVARESVEYACNKINDDSTLESLTSDYVSGMNASLERTPELLPVLKDAGVIDSGGAGLYFIADGAKNALLGKEIEPIKTENPIKSDVDLSKFDENRVMEYGYCTEFLLQLQTSKTDISSFSVDDLIEKLNTLGDSIVAVQNGSVVKIHIHTMNPENVLAYCHQLGEFLTLKIENMTLQHHDTTIQNRFENKPTPAQRKKYGVVAVADGEGIKATLSDLGADIVIDGGQTKNPATEDFIDAFDKLNADTVFVFPNSRNIVLAANQAAKLYDKSDVRILNSQNIGDCYSALSMFDTSSEDTDKITNELNQSMQGVCTAEISKCVRDAKIQDFSVKQGDYIGIFNKEIQAADNNRKAAVCATLDKLDFSNHYVCIIIRGKDSDEQEANEIQMYVQSKYPDTETYIIDGKQDIYSYILIAE